jgi:hypothetical protein
VAAANVDDNDGGHSKRLDPASPRSDAHENDHVLYMHADFLEPVAEDKQL